MLPARSFAQKSKTLNPSDEKTFSTYQDDYSSGTYHGNLVKHYGNNAYLKDTSHLNTYSNAKPFLSPSYHNITSRSYMSNRLSDYYSNNFQTSPNNMLHRTLHSAPVRTKLNHFYENTTAPIAEQDKLAIYEGDYLGKYVHDHFVSQRPIKTETQTLRDIIADYMEFSDSLRNQAFNATSRKLFSLTASDETCVIDKFAEMFSKLMASMQDMLMSYNKLNTNSFELKKMSDNMVFVENVVDRNLWDRKQNPDFEREKYKSTELSIIKDRQIFKQQKSFAQKILKEAEGILKLMEIFVYKNLKNLFEEVRVIFLNSLNNQDYQKKYLRDSNGYIKTDLKLPMKPYSWLILAAEECNKMKHFQETSLIMNEKVIDGINNIGQRSSEQWLKTHAIAGNQIEAGLEIHSKLFSSKIDLQNELKELNLSINDTYLKRNSAKILNEVCLSQLETKLSIIDPNHDQNRKNQSIYTNSVWSKSNDLRQDLIKMKDYRLGLKDAICHLDNDIESCKTGLNYNMRTIVNPRRYHAGNHPSIGLVNSINH